jgi:hypothetical protein
MNFQKVKIQKISKTVSLFAGISFVNQKFNPPEIEELIDKAHGTG